MKTVAVSLLEDEIYYKIISKESISEKIIFPDYLFRGEHFIFDTPSNEDLIFTSFHKHLTKNLPCKLKDEFSRLFIDTISKLGKTNDSHLALIVLPEVFPEEIILKMRSESESIPFRFLFIRKSALNDLIIKVGKSEIEDIRGDSISCRLQKFLYMEECDKAVSNQISLGIKTPDQKYYELFNPDTLLPVSVCISFNVESVLTRFEEFNLTLLGKSGKEYFIVDKISIPEPGKSLDRYLLRITFENAWSGKLILNRNGKVHLSKFIQYPFPVYFT
jgi:hypothetical protein